MEITIQADQANQRCDRFLRKYCKPYPQVRLSDIYSRIRKWEIRVNGRKTKEEARLVLGDVLTLSEELLGKKDKKLTLTQQERKLQKIDLDEVQTWILYEDEDWIVFNKPAGIVIHPSAQHRNDPCMNDYLEFYCQKQGYTKDKSQTFKPSFWYRLDKDTSGVLIAAKNYESLQYINKIIRDRAISKNYMTRVAGKFPKHLVIDKAIEKTYNAKFARAQMQLNDSDGLESKTECRCEKTRKHPLLWEISLVRVKLYSGRMHQIRIHLSSENYPVLGDLIYGKPVINRILNKQIGIKRQLLHCRKYQFTNLDGRIISFEAPLPIDFEEIN